MQSLIEAIEGLKTFFISEKVPYATPFLRRDEVIALIKQHSCQHEPIVNEIGMWICLYCSEPCQDGKPKTKQQQPVSADGIEVFDNWWKNPENHFWPARAIWKESWKSCFAAMQANITAKE